MKQYTVTLVATASVTANVDVEADTEAEAKEKALALATGPGHPEQPQVVFWDTNSDGSGIIDDDIEVEEVICHEEDN